MLKLIEYKFSEIMDGFYDGPHATPDPSNDGPVFLGIKNIKPDGGIDLSDIRHISEREYPKWTKRVVPCEDDIVFSYEATLHRYALIPDGFRGCLGRRMALIRVNKEIVNPLYLYYYFLSPYWEAFVETIKILGSTVDRISITDFPKYKINLPPLPTQQKIASILSAYDDLIENNNQRIQLLEEMAEEIYKEWFVRMRFPNYKNTKFFNAEGQEVPHGTDGALPEGWEKQPLRNCLKHYIGGGWGDEYPKGKNIIPAYVLRGTDIPNFNKGNLNFDVYRYHSESNLSSRTCEVNDIVFEVSGGTEEQSLGRTSFVSKKVLERLNDKLICASFCKLMRFDANKLSPFYMYAMLQRMHKTKELKVFQVQSTGISNYQFESFIDATKISIPANLIQREFSRLYSPILEKIQLLGEKNQLLQETRDLLLPRLMSGKLQVEDLEQMG